MDKIKVGIIGSGTMGSGIAQIAATAGHPTLLFDIDPQLLNNAKNNLQHNLTKLEQKGKIKTGQAKTILSNIQFTTTWQEFQSTSLIIEAIIENLDIKKKLFNDIEKIADPDCILATNTSSLSITSIASICNTPQRVIGIHFFNPAPIMPLVEIIPGLATDSHTTSNAKQLIDSWNKTTVIAKDTPGFIVNRIARPFYGEAIRIYEEGIADIPTIDWAMKEIGGFKMGPFELMDLIGNDINYTVTETIWEQMFFDPRYKPSLTQKRLSESGRFGKKTGQGYYTYTDNAPKPQPKQDQALGEEIFMRIISMLINEAADALYYQVATKEDIDHAMTKAVNYPKGLLKWCDEIGALEIYNMICALHDQYFEDRYRPSVLLSRKAIDETKFY